MSKHEESPAAQLVRLHAFHRRVEQGAGIAFQVMLAGKENFDLSYAEPAEIERLAKVAWAWGVTFAEAAGNG